MLLVKGILSKIVVQIGSHAVHKIMCMNLAFSFFGPF